jgi:hypothetical protein
VRFVVAVLSLVALCSIRAEALPTPDAVRLATALPTCGAAPDDALRGFDAIRPDGNFTGNSDATLERNPIDSPQSTPAPSANSSAANSSQHPTSNPSAPLDANGSPIPIERQQPKRILGFMPNFRSVSRGEAAHPPGWKYNFKVATQQATDYSSFLFLGLTTLSAEGIDEHPALGHGASGFYAYAWRGFLDKSDNTYLSAWLLPSLLHEDTRYYALGNEHSIPVRELYVISRQAVAETYGGHQTPNIAGLGGKVLTQVVSRTYYPPSAASFAVLATKFGYSVMRDVIFTSIREFYPDAAAHFIRKHKAKIAAKAAQAAQQAAPVH